MAEILLEFLVSLFFEGLFEFVADLAFSWLFDWLTPPSPEFKASRRLMWAIIGMIAGGALLGGITVAIAPQPLFSPPGFRGASLVLSPLITGLLMKRYGTWRESRRLEHSHFATFWGGALFAFSMASARFYFVM